MVPANQKPDFVLQTFIRSTVQEVWDALTDPDKYEQYHFFHCRHQGELKVGGRFDDVMPDGSILIGAEILSLDPPRRLEMTFEPRWEEGLAPSRMAYELEQKGEAVKLTILHWDLSAELEGISTGWSEFASSLKSWIETGKPLIVPSEHE